MIMIKLKSLIMIIVYMWGLGFKFTIFYLEQCVRRLPIIFARGKILIFGLRTSKGEN